MSIDAIDAEFEGLPAPRRPLLARVARVALIVYMNVAALSVPYFVWQSAQGVGFFDWLLECLPLVPVKAILWPLFLWIG